MDPNKFFELFPNEKSKVIKALETSRQALNNYLSGRRCPSYKIQDKIMTITGGRITPHDWYELYQKNKKSL